jgi:2-methylcitrate dehydratase PrpD
LAKADLALATENLGINWQIEEVAIKPFPACHLAHASADAAIALHQTHGLPGDAIRRIRVLVPREAVDIVCEPIANKRRPAGSYDAQFSIPYIVATGLLKGRFTLGELEDAALHDAAVLNLAARVEYEADPDSTFPRHYSGEVIVDTKDGRSLRHREAINRGCADRPLTNDGIVAKFLDTAQRAVSRPAAERVLNAVLNFDRASARTLADALCAVV